LGIDRLLRRPIGVPVALGEDHLVALRHGDREGGNAMLGDDLAEHIVGPSLHVGRIEAVLRRDLGLLAGLVAGRERERHRERHAYKDLRTQRLMHGAPPENQRSARSRIALPGTLRAEIIAGRATPRQSYLRCNISPKEPRATAGRITAAFGAVRARLMLAQDSATSRANAR